MSPAWPAAAALVLACCLGAGAHGQASAPFTQLDPQYSISEGESFEISVDELISDPDTEYVLVTATAPGSSISQVTQVSPETLRIRPHHDRYQDFVMTVQFMDPATSGDSADRFRLMYDVAVRGSPDAPRFSGTDQLGTYYVGYEVSPIQIRTFDPDGKNPVIHQCNSCTIPAGLSMDSSGEITGTPESAGTYEFTVEIFDAAALGASRTRTFHMNVSDAVPPTISAVLPNAYEGRPYSANIIYDEGDFDVHHYTLWPGDSAEYLVLDGNYDLAINHSAWSGGAYSLPGREPADIIPYNAVTGGRSGTATFVVSAYSEAEQSPYTRITRQAFEFRLSDSDHPLVSVDHPYEVLDPAYTVHEGGSFTLEIGDLISSEADYVMRPGDFDPGRVASTAEVAADAAYEVVLDPDAEGDFYMPVWFVHRSAAGEPEQGFVHEYLVDVRPVPEAPRFETPADLGIRPVSEPIVPLRISAADPDLEDAVSPTVFAVVGGALPAGLAMDSRGLVTGTPNATGTFSFDVMAYTEGRPPEAHPGEAALRTYKMRIDTLAPVAISPRPVVAVEGSPYLADVTYETGDYDVHHYSLESDIAFLALDINGDLVVDRTLWPDGVYSLPGGTDADIVPYNAVTGGDPAASGAARITAYRTAAERPDTVIGFVDFEVNMRNSEYPYTRLGASYAADEGGVIAVAVEDLLSHPDTPYEAVGLGNNTGELVSLIFADPARYHEELLLDDALHDKVATVSPFKSPRCGDSCQTLEGVLLPETDGGILIGLDPDNDADFALPVRISPGRTPGDPTDDFVLEYPLAVSPVEETPLFGAAGHGGTVYTTVERTGGITERVFGEAAHLGTYFVGEPLDVPLGPYDPDTEDAGKAITCFHSGFDLPDGLGIRGCSLRGTPTAAFGTGSWFEVGAYTAGKEDGHTRQRFTMAILEGGSAAISASPGTATEGQPYAVDVEYTAGTVPIDHLVLEPLELAEYLTLNGTGDVVVDRGLWGEGIYAAAGGMPADVVPYNAIPDAAPSATARFAIHAYSDSYEGPETLLASEEFAFTLLQADSPPVITRPLPSFAVTEGGTLDLGPAPLVSDPDTEWAIAGHSGEPAGTLASGSAVPAGYRLVLDADNNEPFEVAIALSPASTLPDTSDDLQTTITVVPSPVPEPPRFSTPRDLGDYYDGHGIPPTQLAAYDPDPDDAGRSIIFEVVSGSPPPGVLLDRSGLLTGAPVSPVDADFTVRIHTAGKPAEFAVRDFRMDVSDGDPVFINGTFPDAAEGSPYSVDVEYVEGAVPVHHYTLESSHPFLAFNGTDDIVIDRTLWPDGIYALPGAAPADVIPYNTVPYGSAGVNATVAITAWSAPEENLQTRITRAAFDFEILLNDVPYEWLEKAYSVTEPEDSDDPPAEIALAIDDLIRDPDDSYVISGISDHGFLTAVSESPDGTSRILRVHADHDADFELVVSVSNAHTPDDPSDDLSRGFNVTVAPTPDRPRFASPTFLGTHYAGHEARATFGVGDPDTADAGRDLLCTVVAGALPGGMALDGCAAAGTPTAAGEYAFRIRAVTDGGDPPGSRQKNFEMTVADGTPVLITAVERTAKEGNRYTLDVEYDEGEHTVHHYSIESVHRAEYLVLKSNGDVKVDRRAWPDGVYSTYPNPPANVIPYNAIGSKAETGTAVFRITAYSGEDEVPGNVVGTATLEQEIQRTNYPATTLTTPYTVDEGSEFVLYADIVVFDPDNDWEIIEFTPFSEADAARIVSAVKEGLGYRLVLDPDNTLSVTANIRVRDADKPDSDPIFRQRTINVVPVPDPPRFVTGQQLPPVTAGVPAGIELEAYDPDPSDAGKEFSCSLSGGELPGGLGLEGCTITGTVPRCTPTVIDSPFGPLEACLPFEGIPEDTEHDVRIAVSTVGGDPPSPADHPFTLTVSYRQPVSITADPQPATEGQPYTLDVTYDEGDHSVHHYSLEPTKRADYFRLKGNGDVRVDRTLWPDGVYSTEGGTDADVVPYNAINSLAATGTSKFTISAWSAADEVPANLLASLDVEVPLVQTDIPHVARTEPYVVREGTTILYSNFTVRVAAIIEDRDNEYLMTGFGSDPDGIIITSQPDTSFPVAGYSHFLAIPDEHDTDWTMLVTVSPVSTAAARADDIVLRIPVEMVPVPDRHSITTGRNLGTHLVDVPLNITIAVRDHDTADADIEPVCTSAGLPPGLSFDGCFLVGTPTDHGRYEMTVGAELPGSSPSGSVSKDFVIVIDDPRRVVITADPGPAKEGDPYTLDVEYDTSGRDVHHYSLEPVTRADFFTLDSANDVVIDRTLWPEGLYKTRRGAEADVIPYNLIGQLDTADSVFTITAYSEAAESPGTAIGSATFAVTVEQTDLPFVRVTTLHTVTIDEGGSHEIMISDIVAFDDIDWAIADARPTRGGIVYEGSPTANGGWLYVPGEDVDIDHGVWPFLSPSYSLDDPSDDIPTPSRNGDGGDIFIRIDEVPTAPRIAPDFEPLYVGVPANITLGAYDPDLREGGPFTCTRNSGSLPPGITLTDCRMEGTPTTAGDYTLTISVSNNGSPRTPRLEERTVTVLATVPPTITADPQPATEGQPYSIDVAYDEGGGTVHHYSLTPTKRADYFTLDSANDVIIDRTLWPGGVYSTEGGTDADVVPYNAINSLAATGTSKFTISAWGAADEVPANMLASLDVTVPLVQTDIPHVARTEPYVVREGTTILYSNFTVRVAAIIEDRDNEYLMTGFGSDPDGIIITSQPDTSFGVAGYSHFVTIDDNHDTDWTMLVTVSPVSTAAAPADDFVLRIPVEMVPVPDRPSFASPRNLGTVHVGHPAAVVLVLNDPDAADADLPRSCALSAGTLPPGLAFSGCTLAGTPDTAGTYVFEVDGTVTGGLPERPATKEFQLVVDEGTPVSITAAPAGAVEGQPYSIDVTYDEGSHSVDHYSIDSDYPFFTLDSSNDVIIDRTLWPDGIYALPGGTPADVIPYNTVSETEATATIPITITAHGDAAERPANRLGSAVFEVAVDGGTPASIGGRSYTADEGGTLDLLGSGLVSDPDTDWHVLAYEADPGAVASHSEIAGGFRLVLDPDSTAPFGITATVSPTTAPGTGADDYAATASVTVTPVPDLPRFVTPQDLGSLYAGFAGRIDLELYDPDGDDAGKGFVCANSTALPPGLEVAGCSLRGTPAAAGNYTFTLAGSTAGGDPPGQASSEFSLEVLDGMPVVITAEPGTATEGQPYAINIIYDRGSHEVHHYALESDLPFLEFDHKHDIVVNRTLWEDGVYARPGGSPADVMPYNAIPDARPSADYALTITAYLEEAESLRSRIARETFEFTVLQTDLPYVQGAGFSLVEPDVTVVAGIGRLVSDPDNGYVIRGIAGVPARLVESVVPTAPGTEGSSYNVTMIRDNDVDFAIDVELSPDHTPGDPADDFVLRYPMAVTPVPDPTVVGTRGDLGTYYVDHPVSIDLNVTDPDTSDREKPRQCSLTAGALPGGLALEGCVILGTPEAAGDYGFEVEGSIAGANPPGPDTARLTMAVSDSEPVTITAEPGAATEGQPYSIDVEYAEGDFGVHHYSLESDYGFFELNETNDVVVNMTAWAGGIYSLPGGTDADVVPYNAIGSAPNATAVLTISAYSTLAEDASSLLASARLEVLILQTDYPHTVLDPGYAVTEQEPGGAPAVIAVTVPGIISDPDTEYVITGVGGHAAVSSAPADPGMRTYTVTVAENQEEDFEMEATVSPEGTAGDPSDDIAVALAVAVTPTPDPPAFLTPPDLGFYLRDEPLEVQLEAADPDAADAGKAVTFTIVPGGIPAGLAMDAAGLISGTPIAVGDYVLDVGITTEGDPAGSRRTFVMHIVDARPVTISASPGAAVEGSPYFVDVGYAGTSPVHHYSLESELEFLALDGNNDVVANRTAWAGGTYSLIGGTPADVVPYNAVTSGESLESSFTVTAYNQAAEFPASVAGSATFAVTVHQTDVGLDPGIGLAVAEGGSLELAPAALINNPDEPRYAVHAVTGHEYAADLVTVPGTGGAPASHSLEMRGDWDRDLDLAVTFRPDDGSADVEITYGLSVEGDEDAPAFWTLPDLGTVQAWDPYHLTFDAYDPDSDDAAKAITIAAAGLPPGLSASGGAISGTPTAYGSYTIAVTATTDGEPGSAGSVDFELEVAASTSRGPIPDPLPTTDDPSFGPRCPVHGSAYEIEYMAPVGTGGDRVYEVAFLRLPEGAENAVFIFEDDGGVVGGFSSPLFRGDGNLVTANITAAEFNNAGPGAALRIAVTAGEGTVLSDGVFGRTQDLAPLYHYEGALLDGAAVGVLLPNAHSSEPAPAVDSVWVPSGGTVRLAAEAECTRGAAHSGGSPVIIAETEVLPSGLPCEVGLAPAVLQYGTVAAGSVSGARPAQTVYNTGMADIESFVVVAGSWSSGGARMDSGITEFRVGAGEYEPLDSVAEPEELELAVDGAQVVQYLVNLTGYKNQDLAGTGSFEQPVSYAVSCD